MLKIIRPSRVATLALLLAVLSLAGPAHAQSSLPTPTAEQVEVFRNLTPEQQQRVLEQMRGGAADAATTGQPLEFPATQRPKSTATDRQLIESFAREPRLEAAGSLILAVSVRPAAPDGPPQAARAALEQQRTLMLAGNPYRLDRTGQLALPRGPTVPLAGLTATQAAQRLNTEPSLEDFSFGVTLLPVEPVLKPFGYDLFRSSPSTFAPATDVPVPSEYVLGPGDTLEVQLVGEGGGNYRLTVGRDGVIDFPKLGPVAVAGMRFDSAQALLEQRVQQQMIGLRAAVSMGALRSIQVFVLGEVEQPGSYTVSGLSTATHALFASGGVKPIGSLRNIQLKRNGKVVRKLDLYDLLLEGDTSADLRLQPGDVVFVPPVGTTVAVTGEIRRPAVYELREGAPAADLLYVAGGLTPEADPRTATLERIDARRNRTVVDLDLTTPAGRSTRVQTGDVLRIAAIRASVEGAVSLEGHVFRPATVQFRPGMRLTDLVGSADDLRPRADLDYVLIRRESGPDRRVSVLSASLRAALAGRRGADDIALEPRDRVVVFDLASSRDRVVAPIVEELRRQSDAARPTQTVGIGGRVKVPGQYPLEPGMTVADLLRAGGGLDEAAYVGEAELTRYEVVDGEKRQTQLLTVDLRRIAAGDASADVALAPFDFLLVKEMPAWGERESVTLSGEVRFPGTYAIQRGETLRSLIERAGGLTDLAFPEGAVFTRQELREREQRQLAVLADRMERELAAAMLAQSQSPSNQQQSADAVSLGQSLLASLKNARAAGRLVLDLRRAMAATPGSRDDVVLKNGDLLAVPRTTQEVTVIGEVQNATSHLYQAGLGRSDYVALSGGTTRRADGSRTFVIRADGSVVAGKGGLFRRNGDSEIRAGDTIVVPLDAERMRPLPLWASVTQIIYNLAIAAAAVNSF